MAVNSSNRNCNNDIKYFIEKTDPDKNKKYKKLLHKSYFFEHIFDKHMFVGHNANPWALYV